MTTSHAARLQNAVLRIASQMGDGLDLSQVSSQKSAFQSLSEGTFLAGEKVLIAGAASGRTAFEAARQVGDAGSVLAVESDAEQLQRAQEQETNHAEQIGYRNWTFAHGELQDYRTRTAFVANYLSNYPVSDVPAYRAFQDAVEKQRTDDPLVSAESLDVVFMDTVINRLPDNEARHALTEAFRVLRRGGRILLSVVLADEAGSPDSLPKLPNGLTIRYVPQETEIITLLDEAGFHGMSYTYRAELPMQVVAGIELRAFVVEAYKGKQGICLDQGHAVIFKGPWKEVVDDDGHRYVRGERTAVCEKTYGVLMRAPYQGQLIGVPSYREIPLSQAPLFDCNTPQLRDPLVTKGKKSVFDQTENSSSSSCCAPSDDGGCC